jgi:gliding motility-associated-like protein
MKLKNLLLLALIAFMPFGVMATHVVGGSLTYEHLGGSSYRVTFKMYRDCGPSSIQLPTSVRIEVRQPNGASFSPDKDIVIPKTQVSVLDPPIDTCAFDPGICVEEAIYTTIVNNLPPNPGGYHLYYSTCCRNASIVNVLNPLSSGESFYTYIPDNSLLLTNSSPQWKNFTPIFVCQGNPLVFDHGATDKDGDSLAYSFYNPFDDNAPTFPGNVATFTPIGYNGGYSSTNPLGGGGFVVDPNTGVITGMPPMLGQFVVGVKVDEYRNGNLINTVYRDFQFNVINCPPIPTPGIGPTTGCSGLAIPFTNTSTPLAGNSFYWDFGDPSSTTDNSTLVNPTYAYPSIGTYIVMLIAQAGTPCADTIYDTLTVSGVTPDFTYTDTACVNSPANFNDTSIPTANATTNSWIWDFGDAGSATTPTPTHIYSTPGTYSVQLVVGTTGGCFDSISQNIFIQPLPQAVAIDTFACVSNPVTNLNGSVIGASGGIWSGLGSFNPSTSDLNAAYTPTAAELFAGYATIVLTTTGNGFCPSVSDTMTLSFSVGITANAGNDTSVCKDVAAIPLSGSVITASGGQWVSSGTGSFQPNPFDMNASYIPSSADTAAGSVFIYLNSIGNGNCAPDADTIAVTFTSIPISTILSNDTACAGNIDPFNINANSTTGSGYWQTLGSGYFSPNDSLNNTNYFADSLDNFNGNVTLVFTSTNNGGCQAYSDTLNIALIPAPTANFTFSSVCVNDTMFFTDSTIFVDPIISWNWDFGNNLIDSFPNTSTVYDTGGVYSVNLIVASLNGCTDTISKDVYVQPLPQALAVDTFACISNPVTNLNGNAIGASGGFWLGAGTFNPDSTNLNAAYTPTAAELTVGFATLILTTTGNGLCPADLDTMIISYNVGITADAGNDIIVCEDTMSIPLSGIITTANGGEWVTSGTGTFQPNQFDMGAVYIPSSADSAAGSVTIYLNSVGNGNCVPASDTLLITFLSLTTTTILSNDTACAGSIFMPISANSSTGTGYWQTLGSGYFSPNDSLINTNYYLDSLDNINGNVTLVFISTNNSVCKGSADTLIIDLIDPPAADFSLSSGCITDTLSFNDLTTFIDPIISWQWDFGDGGADSLQNPTYSYSNSGSYNVTLTVQSVIGCMDTILKPINILPAPTAGFLSSPESVQINDNFIFSDLSFTNIISWQWDFGDSLGTSTLQNPSYSYSSAGNYTVCLTITDITNCKDVICEEVIVFMPPVVPNAFSPNGIGENNVFNVLGGPYKELDFKIYNNWGELIFESDKQSIGWDGTRNGVEQPIGVYIYTVRAVTLDDERHTIKGDVTLLR